MDKVPGFSLSNWHKKSPLKQAFLHTPNKAPNNNTTTPTNMAPPNVSVTVVNVYDDHEETISPSPEISYKVKLIAYKWLSLGLRYRIEKLNQELLTYKNTPVITPQTPKTPFVEKTVSKPTKLNHLAKKISKSNLKKDKNVPTRYEPPRKKPRTETMTPDDRIWTGTLASSESISSEQDSDDEVNEEESEEDDEEEDEEMVNTSVVSEASTSFPPPPVTPSNTSPQKIGAEKKTPLLFKKPVSNSSASDSVFKSKISKSTYNHPTNNKKITDSSQRDGNSHSNHTPNSASNRTPLLLKTPIRKIKDFGIKPNPIKGISPLDFNFSQNLTQNLTQLVSENPSQVVSSIRHKVQDLSSDNLTSALSKMKGLLEENDIAISQNSK